MIRLFSAIKILRYLFERLWLKFSLRHEKQVFKRRVKGNTFYCSDKWAYLSALKEIYIEECYLIDPRYKINGILDIGSNFGFSIAHFKQLYPDAKVTSFEADSFIYNFLKKNVVENKMQDVELINAAAWIKDEKLEFYQDFSQGGSLSKTDIHSSKIEIEAQDIKKYTASGRYDLLKIDIEGSETELVTHIGNDLKNFKLVFIEYHEPKGQIGSLSKILKVLEDNGFKYSFSKVFGTDNLFSKYISTSSFDLQLNIYAVKKDLLKK